MAKTQRICLWSGPRNVSSALMYSFAQRSDTQVVDEPLYGHYLRVSQAVHPNHQKVMQAMDCDGERVVQQQILGDDDRAVVFFKQMAHHLVDLDRSFLDHTQNVLLIRDPAEVLATLSIQIPEPILRDTGYAVQCELLQQDLTRGRSPLVLDAKQLLLDPAQVLEKLCVALGLQFEPEMLHWPAGPKPYDGVWAPDWYHSLHKSTGFMPYQAKTERFPERLEDLLQVCQPLYQQLFEYAIKVE